MPFTSDDGFMLTSSSPARDAGTNVGLTGDILGNPIAGNPDIGPYEYQTTAISYNKIADARQDGFKGLSNPLSLKIPEGVMVNNKEIRVYDMRGSLVQAKDIDYNGVCLIQRGDGQLIKAVIIR